MCGDGKDFPVAFPSPRNEPGVVCRNASTSASGGFAGRQRTRKILVRLLSADKQSHRWAAGSTSEPEAGVGQAGGSAEGRTA
ncbi:hypothetical protein [Treponema endosymbiont of Eucomonympha sp.]|uniref:hypothetical protein n=1 Tax=Treponema endosymbiont of Eucomonympha sp. TaxID=1580831 RepID=UPI00075147D8|nr:hypothetical protein [Treponema endosymbiont of Eucomonympha sp.]